MPSTASELARRLAANAEAVCRHYLSNGYRQGRYWLVGDVGNTPGSSLYVRLHGPEAGPGAAGKWTDAATGEHGDLLDLIAANRRIDATRDVLDEARRFLRLPVPEAAPAQSPAPAGSPEAARRLFAASQSIAGTIAETYLRERGITALRDCAALRFHPRCYYRRMARFRATRARLAGARGSHQRSRRHDDRGAPHLARSVRPHEGAGRNAKTRDGQSPRQRGAVRDSARRHGGRRGHRDDAITAERHAGPAHGRRTLRQPSRRPRCCLRRCAAYTSRGTTTRPDTARRRSLTETRA